MNYVQEKKKKKKIILLAEKCIHGIQESEIVIKLYDNCKQQNVKILKKTH